MNEEFGAITRHIDVAQLTLYAFWLFFLGLVLYLLRENNRDGFPLVSETKGPAPMPGLLVPGPKEYLLHDGTKVMIPRPASAEPPFAARPSQGTPGSPFIPTGNPLVDQVGPASYATREDHPDLTWDDRSPKIVPLRAANSYFLAQEDPDPRGMNMLGLDDQVAGKVVDVWVDKSEYILRFYEVELPSGKRVLIPSAMVTIDFGRTRCKTVALKAEQFADIPTTKHPEQITLLEEDRISTYVGGGYFYATPDRNESFV